MRRVLLMIVCAFMLSTNLWAKQLVPLSVNIDDDEKPLGHGHGRSSIGVPQVYIDDYMLSFEANHPEYILIIKDEDSDVVFFSVVYSVQNQVVLPSILSGDYAIELVVDNLLFTGWINL